MIKKYFSLTKSGLVLGNLITVVAGFVLGLRGYFNIVAFIAVALGMFLVMASGCVFNNVIDRGIDGLMDRTKERVLVRGVVLPRSALIFATLLGIAGFFLLIIFTNFLVFCIALFGFFFYVAMYSLWFKRRTVWGTVVGSISGAVPPVAGYAAASGRIDIAALILFAIMVVWQMPHFFAIALRRADEYAAAHVPVLPVVSGVRATKWQMLGYIVAFTIIAPMLTVFGYLGTVYFIVAVALGIGWLILCIRGFWISDASPQNKKWSRQMFFCSLVVMVVLFGSIAGRI